MNKTPNYSLSQWSRDDRVLMDDFNSDNAKIDGALGEHARQLAKLPFCGNCQIYTTTYVGTGQYGGEYPNSLTFPKAPTAVMIITSDTGRSMWFVQGCPKAFYWNNNGNLQNCVVTWDGNSLSWYSPYLFSQMNAQNITYHVIAFAVMD